MQGCVGRGVGECRCSKGDIYKGNSNYWTYSGLYVYLTYRVTLFIYLSMGYPQRMRLPRRLKFAHENNLSTFILAERLATKS